MGKLSAARVNRGPYQGKDLTQYWRGSYVEEDSTSSSSLTTRLGKMARASRGERPLGTGAKIEAGVAEIGSEMKFCTAATCTTPAVISYIGRAANLETFQGLPEFSRRPNASVLK